MCSCIGGHVSCVLVCQVVCIVNTYVSLGVYHACRCVRGCVSCI